ncbi:MAG: PHP domain-containing protein [Acidobacteria bacterium]|nr:PHP domain-containing protein [Acidobacteriota bacterium]
MIDLHMHSNFSDGSDDPEVLAVAARKAGLSTIALTDHDTTDSHERMAAACAAEGIELIPGVEVSLTDPTATKVRDDGTTEKSVSVHVLAYFVPLDPVHPFQQKLLQLRHDRQKRNIALVSLLHENGFTRLNYEEILQRAKSEYSVGRPHFAQAMFDYHPEIVGEQTPENWQKLFNEWLGQGGKAYLRKTELTISSFVEAGRGSGVVFSIAHPTLNYFGHSVSDQEIAERFPAILASLHTQGVKGVECFYGSWPERRRQLLLSLARNEGMIPTGGSDYHGTVKKNVHIGRGLEGDLHVPDSVLDELRTASAANYFTA